MFADLSSGLEKKYMTPMASNMITQTGMNGMIAEPAQVMVMVPGTRAQTAENALGTLKTYITVFATVVVLGLFAMMYFWFFKEKKPQYAGKTLPGIADFQESRPDVQARPESKPNGPVRPWPESRPVRPTALSAEMPVPKSISFEDIVSVDGPFPVWDTPEETSNSEKRVSENDESIANIIKAREALTKDIESYMSSGMKS